MLMMIVFSYEVELSRQCPQIIVIMDGLQIIHWRLKEFLCGEKRLHVPE